MTIDQKFHGYKFLRSTYEGIHDTCENAFGGSNISFGSKFREEWLFVFSLFLEGNGLEVFLVECDLFFNKFMNELKFFYCNCKYII